MGTLFTERLTLVVRAGNVTAANAALQMFDPDGGPMLTVPLRTAGDAQNITKAYIASGVFTADVPDRMANKINTTIFHRGDTVPRTRNYWLFDSSWSVEAILPALGFDRVDQA